MSEYVCTVHKRIIPCDCYPKRVMKLEKELSEARAVIEERGHAFQKAVNDALLERDKYKRLCAQMRLSLEKVKDKQPEALETIRKHKFVFDGKGGRWEKMALTLYSDICSLRADAIDCLEAYEEAVK